MFRFKQRKVIECKREAFYDLHLTEPGGTVANCEGGK